MNRICRDCRHSEKAADGTLAPKPYCMHPLAAWQEGEVDPVTGAAPEKRWRFCEDMRQRPDIIPRMPRCTPEGRWWAPIGVAAA